MEKHRAIKYFPDGPSNCSARSMQLGCVVVLMKSGVTVTGQALLLTSRSPGLFNPQQLSYDFSILKPW